ncbi:site-specific recombinase [Streptacidiphilus sp. N1-12]|uniref:Site-specific recombinase n=2 Tax=Streptacidiphilus alkalitolerans TaxID=3342712 RepID=A0ABV6V3M4_9ACTN
MTVGHAAGPQDYLAAVDCYLLAARISESSARIYRISLVNWSWLLAGRPTPLGQFRRGAEPPALALAVLDDPALPRRLAEFAAARADAVDSDTVQRELSILRKAIRWWRGQGWISADPTQGIEQRPSAPQTAAAQLLSPHQIARLWQLEAPLRERTLWRLVHEGATPVEALLALNVEDVLPSGGERPRRRLHGQPGTVRSLARLIGVRRSGPLFLTAVPGARAVASRDRCPITGWTRLPVRQAEDIFERGTRLLANPLADGRQLRELRGWTLRQLYQAGLAPVPASPFPDRYGRGGTGRAGTGLAAPGAEAPRSRAHLAGV